MFQISSGVFFDTDKIEKHEGTFIFYSNIDVFFPLESNFPEFKLKKINGGGVNCYLVNYVLLTEKPDKIEPGVVIRAGDEDYIQQFILLWEFYFECVARLEKESVKKICTQLNFNKMQSKIALEVAPHLVVLNRNIPQDFAFGFRGFVKNVVNLDRIGYKSVIAALKIISDSKESLSTNFDLTYSMLVYALESLSQRNDEYKSVWEDYDQKTRNKLEMFLKNLPLEVSAGIKNVLIEDKQFKLLKRFKTFIINNLNNDFFYESDRFPIRGSYLDKALENLYKIRSSFVHELKPLCESFSEPYNPIADSLFKFGQPYFTYSGLLRLLRHVITNYCRKNPSKKRETVNWIQETSGLMTAELHPECWIHKRELFKPSFIGKWFGEYLEMLNKSSVIDMQEIMLEIEIIFDNSPKEYKSGLLHFYCLYNCFHNQDKSEWREFVEERKNFLKNDIYQYLSCVYLHNSLININNATADLNRLNDFISCFNDYNANKCKPTKLNLPAMSEVLLLACAANSYFKIGKYKDYELTVEMALKEVSSINKVFTYIRNKLADSQHIEIEKCLELYREKSS